MNSQQPDALPKQGDQYTSCGRIMRGVGYTLLGIFAAIRALKEGMTPLPAITFIAVSWAALTVLWLYPPRWLLKLRHGDARILVFTSALAWVLWLLFGPDFLQGLLQG